MKKLLSAIFLFGLIIAASFLSSCGKSDGSAAEGKNSKLQISVNVRVQELSPVRFEEVIQIAGTVKALDDVMLSPEEGGVVKEWKVQKGQRVKKGDLIAVLKDDLLRAGFEAAESQFKMAQMNFEKQGKMFSEQAISEMQYKSTEYGRDGAKAQADLMKTRLANTQIKSPIDGIVDDRFVDAGEMAAPGMPLARIVNISTVKIAAEVPERQSGEVSLGTAVSVTFDAVPGDTVRGMISFVGSAISQTNRTLPVEILLDNKDRKLKPEMVAKVRVVQRSKTGAIVISENIPLLVDRNRLIVYIVENGLAKERVITVGGRKESSLEIVSGLTAGDRLIVSGFQKVVNDLPVNVVRE